MSIILCSNLHRFGERRGHPSLNQRPVTSLVSESDGSDYESASELNVLDCTGGRYSSIEMSASGQEKNFIHWKNAQSTSRTDQVYLVWNWRTYHREDYKYSTFISWMSSKTLGRCKFTLLSSCPEAVWIGKSLFWSEVAYRWPDIWHPCTEGQNQFLSTHLLLFSYFFSIEHFRLTDFLLPLFFSPCCLLLHLIFHSSPPQCSFLFMQGWIQSFPDIWHLTREKYQPLTDKGYSTFFSLPNSTCEVASSLCDEVTIDKVHVPTIVSEGKRNTWQIEWAKHIDEMDDLVISIISWKKNFLYSTDWKSLLFSSSQIFPLFFIRFFPVTLHFYSQRCHLNSWTICGTKMPARQESFDCNSTRNE